MLCGAVRNMNPTQITATAHPADPAAWDRATTVLLADDDDDFREMVRLRLLAEGYEVSVALDGGDALERLGTLLDAEMPLPDVLILDFVMPKLSGLGVLRALWRLGRVPPTLIITGFGDRSVDAFARNLGALHVLRKPIDEIALSAAVAEAGELSRRHDESRR